MEERKKRKEKEQVQTSQLSLKLLKRMTGRAKWN